MNYSLEKMLPLLTLWSFNAVAAGQLSVSSLTIRPERIVKSRVRQGVDCVEIIWSVTGSYISQTGPFIGGSLPYFYRATLNMSNF